MASDGGKKRANHFLSPTRGAATEELKRLAAEVSPARNSRKESLRRSLSARMDTNDYADDDAIWDEI